jgi:hypothetical protein
MFKPLSPPLKPGSASLILPVAIPTMIQKHIVQKAVDTNATEFTTGVPISDKYKIIPALKYEDRVFQL